MSRLTWILATSLMCAGCAAERPLGVLSLNFALEASVPHELPVELQALDMAELAAVSGSVEVDGEAKNGMVMGMALPELPDGWTYVPSIRVERNARAGLEGGGAEESGHAHGARATPDAEGHEEEEGHEDDHGGPVEVVLEAMLEAREGEYQRAFKAADLPGVPVGGIRAAEVYVVPADGEVHDGVEVLSGTLSLEDEGGAPEEEDAGHAHGA